VAKSNQYHPVSKKRYPPKRHHQSPQVSSRGIFQGNLVNGMRFGGKDHDLSGYVLRTVVMKDRYGNIQIAKEKQFFNSSKNGMRIRINDQSKKD
jgi:hypothetical protein